jgi:actin-related protein
LFDFYFINDVLNESFLIKVHAGTDRQHAAYIGASVVARLPLFEELCITQDEWNDLGTDALEKWQNL